MPVAGRVELAAVLLSEIQGQAWFWIFDNLASHPVEPEQLWTGLRLVFDFAPFVALLPLLFINLAIRRQAQRG